MKQVDAEEFREHPAEYLSRGEALAIEQQGTPIGIYIPVVPMAEAGSDLLERLRHALSSALVDAYQGGDNSAAAVARHDREAEERRQAVERLGQAIDRLLATSGMTEDELADVFDLSKPPPRMIARTGVARRKPMKRVEIQEVHERTAEYLSGGEVLTVEHQGVPVGMYIPAAQSTADDSDSLTRLRQAIARALEGTGWSEDDLADALDLRKPA